MSELSGHPPRRAHEPLGTDLEAVGFIVLTIESPSDGDVLITTEGGRHLLSIVPHPHRLTLSEHNAALQIAKRWARAHNVAVWRTSDGVFMKVASD